MNKTVIITLSLAMFITGCSKGTKSLTGYVNPFLGTATLWDSADLGYTRKISTRTWGAEVFPGSSLPNAMVQVSPVTMYRSGAGYQYEDTVIFGFSHTNKGHWNLLHVPILPLTGEITADNYYSPFKHSNESARPGYYQVFLEKYGVNAEMTSTLRSAYHRYTYNKGDAKKLLVDLERSNERVRDWEISQAGDNIFTGYQQAGEKIYFYAVSNHDIETIDIQKDGERQLPVVLFAENPKTQPLELKIGFSFVSIDGAKANLEKEVGEKNFKQIAAEADKTWENLLSHITVEGGTERQKGLFYSCLYRSFMWPALRSDASGDFTDVNGEVQNKGFHYYTDPSFWDDYRNKLVLLGMISPKVTADVISSLTDKGEKRDGFMPIFFHGDHASAFLAGTYLRGIEGYDINRAYQLVLKNATVENRRARPYLNEYIEQGWISEEVMDPPFVIHDERKAAVTKTLEYSYDDYSVALIAKALGDDENYKTLMARTGNYKNVFNPANGFMQGRFEDGSWLEPFDPYFPYYAYMYREANAWQSIFYVPHDPEGMIALFPSKDAAEAKLDSLFSLPWRGYEAHNMTGFIGQYCHGNQPDHSFSHMYYFVDKQEKAQVMLDSCMNHFYDMGKDKLAYCGMDDAGEMSAWYVFNAMGIYTFSPADPEYIVSVPLFDKVTFTMGDGTNFTISKKGAGKKITDISYGGTPLPGYFVSHDDLKKGQELVITTE